MLGLEIIHHPRVAGRATPGPRFNIKMLSSQYRKSHCGDKTVVRASYLHNGISFTGKMSSLYWIGALDTHWCGLLMPTFDSELHHYLWHWTASLLAQSFCVTSLFPKSGINYCQLHRQEKKVKLELKYKKFISKTAHENFTCKASPFLLRP